MLVVIDEEILDFGNHIFIERFNACQIGEFNRTICYSNQAVVSLPGFALFFLIRSFSRAGIPESCMILNLFFGKILAATDTPGSTFF